MVVNWTLDALSALDEIGEYISQFNPERAKTFTKEIKEKTERLADFPKLYQVGEFENVRELVAHKNYKIYYEINEELEEVIILAVRHVARSLPTEF